MFIMIKVVMISLSSLISDGRTTALFGLTPDNVVMSRVCEATSTENSATNAWNVNASNGNVNNNNKNNQNSVRAWAATDYEDVAGWVDAYLDCIHKKLSSTQCGEYRIDYEEDLYNLIGEVYSQTYEPSTSTCFVVKRPRLREIFAAAFRDRIVQHWIAIRINPLLEARFIAQGNVSYNCRKGYGTLLAIETMQDKIARVSAGYRRMAYLAKYDVQAFFMSIDKRILWAKLEPFIRENYTGDDIETLLYLTRITVFHCPQNNCVRTGDLSLWEKLPKGKSLFDSDPNVGMPIGNLTSQLLANFYMSFFDDMAIAYFAESGGEYERFVDDFPAADQSKERLLAFRVIARDFLWRELRLRLHEKKFYIQEARKGMNYVGMSLRPGRKYISNTTRGHYLETLHRAEKICKRIAEKGMDLELSRDLEHAVNGINSYLGLMSHAYSYNVRTKPLASLHYFYRYCSVTRRALVVHVKPQHRYDNVIFKHYEYELELRRAA